MQQDDVAEPSRPIHPVGEPSAGGGPSAVTGKALSAHVVEEIRALPARFPQIRSAVMPALDLAQEELGFLTKEAMSDVAALLNLDPGYVEGVATFYSLFHLQPIGKHHFYICTNLSCSLRGAYELCEHVKRQIGVTEFGEVSSDGLFSVEEVECLGACEYAPMMRYHHRYHYDLTPAKIDELIRTAREGPQQEPPPAETTEQQPSRPRSQAAGRRPSSRGGRSRGPDKEQSRELNA